MNFVAILILMYFMLGFIAGMAISEGRGTIIVPSEASTPEKPPFELPLQLLLLTLLLGLPVLGYRRARKQGEFLRFSPRVWIFLPPLLLMSGFITGILALKYL